MNSILTTCHDMQKKQTVMQDTILDKLNNFRNILEAKRDSLGKAILLSIEQRKLKLN